MSKPLASTVVAGVVDGGTLAWDDPVAAQLPGFALKDPWVTAHVTYADLFSHRSGLPDHSGDLLEDLGYDRTYILDHLKYEPLGPFRASYAYTNYGSPPRPRRSRTRRTRPGTSSPRTRCTAPQA